MYNTYMGCQMNIGNCSGKEYQEGDAVDVPDGVYICTEGIVVIKNNRTLAKFNCLRTKWGDVLEKDIYQGMLSAHDSIQQSAHEALKHERNVLKRGRK